uniref:Uncharacterized protein n=1 Tax=Sinocyclocheilus anshuiensis TaxID=1608454 RepID=A0A671SG93_9TELE
MDEKAFSKELDQWIEQLNECKQLSENHGFCYHCNLFYINYIHMCTNEVTFNEGQCVAH